MKRNWLTFKFNGKNRDSPESLKKGIGYFAYGNTNIICNHIAFFEKLAEKEIDKNKNRPDPSFSEYPYFGAWLRLNVEHITNKLFYDYSRIHGNDIPQKIKWGPSEFIKKASDFLQNDKENNKSQIKKYSDAINIVKELSDCIRHGGIPNISKIVQDTIRNDIEEILNPRNFEQTKQIFKDAVKFSDLLPKIKLIVRANG